MSPPRVSDHGAKVAAGRLGITVAEYREHEAADAAWCSLHEVWHPRSAFSPDRWRASGVQSFCRAGRRRHYPLTPEGAVVVTTARSLTDSEAGDPTRRNGTPPTAASSGHSSYPNAHHGLCPPSVRHLCEGRLPVGWIRSGEVAP